MTALCRKFDEDRARAAFVEHYQLEGKVLFDGKYWRVVKTGALVTDTLLQGTVIVIYDAWMACAQVMSAQRL